MEHRHQHKSKKYDITSKSPILFQNLLDLADKSDIISEIRQLRQYGLESLIIGINSVLPHNLIQSNVALTDKALIFECETVLLNSFSKILIVGGGKATAQMCESVIQIIGDLIPFSGAINVPKGQSVPSIISSPSESSSVEVTFASHPIPDEDGIRGVHRMLDLINESSDDTLVIALISGGGSALMPYPAEGISLEEKQNVNKLLLKCGASINEINTVRKHLSKFKGGQLSQYANPRRIISLILSDVIGNDLQTIASGPTVPDLTTFKDVLQICNRYEIFESLPASVQQRILDGCDGLIPETPKPDPKIFDLTTNIVIGSADTSAETVKSFFIEKGIQCEIFSSELHGEARDYGERLVDLMPKFRYDQLPAAFIGTGEFTVTIKGNGKGGRNQEMLLSFLHELTTDPDHPTNNMTYVIISGAFDGIEGNSPAMGAIIDSNTLERIASLNISISDYLDNNDSFSVFDQLGDVLITDQTGTNVNDMTIILIGKGIQ